MKHPRIKGRGFTLVELIMVMVIVGILAAMAIPTFTAPDNMRVRIGTLRMRSDLRYAVDYALSSGHVIRVDFFNSVSGNRYTIFEKDAAGAWQMLARPGSSDNMDVDLDDLDLLMTSVDINGTSSLYVNSQGIPMDGSLTALSSGMVAECQLNNTKRLRIEPQTALIRMIEG